MKSEKILKPNNKKFKKLNYKTILKIFIFWTILSIFSSTIIILFILLIFPSLPISQGPIAKAQAYAYAARKIAYKSLNQKDTIIQGESANQILENIISERTKNNYLYTGGHYTDFYVRNLGTFANKLISPKAATNANQWLDRVKLMTRSTEVALSVFQSYDQITTTIVQLENGKYVPINIYAAPSDSLPSLLKILDQLNNINQQKTPFPLSLDEQKELDTIADQANTMLQKYRTFLKAQSELYVNSYTDTQTKLIKEDIVLSGIKDSWIRKSSFYDNVMLYSVYNLNSKLNIHSDWNKKADEVKKTLLQNRWGEQSGIFYDEIPSQSCNPESKDICIPFFSADQLIAVEMGMLDPNETNDKTYLEKIIKYIQKNNLDKPFPLKTTEIRIPKKEHLPVRILAPNYTGTTIWSYWGMIYIDLLSTIGTIDKNDDYLTQAKSDLNKYNQNIVEYKGFPELYAPNGQKYQLPFYRSVNDMVWGIYFLYLENQINPN